MGRGGGGDRDGQKGVQRWPSVPCVHLKYKK